MPNHEEGFTLTIPSHSRFLVLVRSVIDQFSQDVGFSELEAHKIVLAVDEACTNIIRHCYQGYPGKRILLKCRACDSGLEIRLKDFGPACDLKEIKSPETVGEKPGGLGLVLIRNAMDEVQFQRTSKVGLELRMFKRLDQPAATN